MRIYIIIMYTAMTMLCSACDTGDNCAPVTELSTIEPIPKSGLHHVKRGETLYEVAWRYGLDYRDVVAQNRMQSPYPIHSGQTLNLRGNQYIKHARHDIEIEPNFSNARWIWPAQGRVIKSYSSNNKGINIRGYLGEPIRASAPGKVVYAGDGLRGYGNLIILKHNNIYLSAYAHASQVFVREGDMVKQGQKIAEMGDSGGGKTMLHFEIRRAGKPVDPISLLGMGIKNAAST